MPRLGQHFLVNKAVLKKICTALDLRPGEAVIEVGAGHGELTETLYQVLRIKYQENTEIVAIEKDPKLAARLHEKFDGKKNIKILEGDVLRVLPSLYQLSTVNCQLSHDATYRIVGNIPYYLTGFLLRTIGELTCKPQRCVFTIQKEVAERITAQPPYMNKLAASVRFWALPTIISSVPRRAFRPPPKVDSAIIVLDTRRDALRPNEYWQQRAARYYQAVHALFGQPRKTILNNVRVMYKELEMKGEGIAHLLRNVGVNPEDRPQNLSVEDIIALAKATQYGNTESL